VANCSSCNGSCSGGSRTCVGALGTLCRTGCRYPYYTGPCPPAPCSGGCGNRCCHPCRCRANAQVIDLNNCDPCGCSNNTCGCNGCNDSCNNNTCGNGCNSCSNTCGCGCDSCSSCSNTCGNGCDACGSCNNACGNFCGYGCNSNWSCRNAGHAVFTAGSPIDLSAGSAVNFESLDTDSHYFALSYGNILIRRPGLYYAAVTVNIPKHTEIDTVLRLEIDGQGAVSPEIPVAAVCSDTTACFSGQAVFHACAGSLLKLSSLREMQIDHRCAQPVFTLTLFRIR